MDKYSIRIFWSEPDGEFVATCPEFPGLSAIMPTRAEALNEAEKILRDFIAITVEDGEPLPVPHIWREGDPTEIRLSENRVEV